jgi:hypothetical protein
VTGIVNALQVNRNRPPNTSRMLLTKMSEHQTEPGFVKNKIKAQNLKKKPGGVARARKEPEISVALAKIVKKAAQIADLMTGEDVEEDLRVLREAKNATHRVYDAKVKAVVQEPDHKIRLAATTLSRAYHEGKPVERVITVHADADDFAERVRRFRNSPEAMRAFAELPGPTELPVIEADSLQSGPNVTSSEKPVEGSVILNEASPDAEK